MMSLIRALLRERVGQTRSVEAFQGPRSKLQSRVPVGSWAPNYLAAHVGSGGRLPAVTELRGGRGERGG